MGVGTWIFGDLAPIFWLTVAVQIALIASESAFAV
jgi:hypothetical protein